MITASLLVVPFLMPGILLAFGYAKHLRELMLLQKIALWISWGLTLFFVLLIVGAMTINGFALFIGLVFLTFFWLFLVPGILLLLAFVKHLKEQRHLQLVALIVSWG
ncbi:MAG: hypothetical protein LBI43_01125 [Streptococcaceae bacterium]|jgi:uncharacterized protein (DUF486 family)|nr:hypothetical protein [Streptococcaceae bacterium]